MRTFNLYNIVAILGISVLTISGSASITTALEKKPNPKRVLAIFAFKQALPWAYYIEESLRAALASQSPYPIELNVEHADRPRYPEEEYFRKVVDFYRYKYSKQTPDLVLALGDELAELLVKYGADLFEDKPVVLVTSETGTLSRDLMKPNLTSLVWGWNIGNTIALIQDLLPQTKHFLSSQGLR